MADDNKKVQYEAINFSDDEDTTQTEKVKLEENPELTTDYLQRISDICGQINNAEKNKLASDDKSTELSTRDKENATGDIENATGGMSNENATGDTSNENATGYVSKDLSKGDKSYEPAVDAMTDTHQRNAETEQFEAPQITIDTAVYTCKLCIKSFEAQNQVEAHLISSHDLGEQTALFTCLKSVKKPKKVWRREKDGYFHCLFCHHRSRRSINIHQHEKAEHEGQELPLKNYVCKLCKEKFALEQIFLHIQNDHADQADNMGFIGNNLAEHYTVNIQSLTKSIKESGSQESLDSMELTVDGQYHCRKCDFVSGELEEFTEHLKEHQPAQRATPRSNTQFKYCQHCPFKTKSERGLRLHERMQHPADNIKKGKTVCNVCGEARTKNAIHACKKKGKKRGRKITLVRDEEGRFLCADCDFKHMNYTTMHMHMKARKHHIQRLNPVVLNVSTESSEYFDVEESSITTRSSAKKSSESMDETEGENRTGEFIIEKDIASCAMIGIDRADNGTISEKNEEKQEVEQEDEKVSGEVSQGSGSLEAFFDSDGDDSIPEDSDDDWTPSGFIKRKRKDDDSDTDESGSGRKRARRRSGEESSKRRAAMPKDPKSPYPLVTESGSFKCNFCEFETKYAQSIELHQWRHTGFKPYSCTDCGKSFRVKRRLEEHKCKMFPNAATAMSVDNATAPSFGHGRETENMEGEPSSPGHLAEAAPENENPGENLKFSERRLNEPSNVPDDQLYPRDDPDPAPTEAQPQDTSSPREITPTEPEEALSTPPPPVETNHIHITPLTEEPMPDKTEQEKGHEDSAPQTPAASSEEPNSTSPTVTASATSVSPTSPAVTAPATLGSPTPIVIQPPLSADLGSSPMNQDAVASQEETSPGDCVVTSFTEARVRNRMPTDSAVPVNITPMLGLGPGLPYPGFGGPRQFMPNMGQGQSLPRMGSGHGMLGMGSSHPMPMMGQGPQPMPRMGAPLEAMSQSIGQISMNMPAPIRQQAIQIEPIVNNQEHNKTNTNGISPPDSTSAQSTQSDSPAIVSNQRVSNVMNSSPLMTSSPRHESSFASSSPAETAGNASGESTPQRTNSHVSSPSSRPPPDTASVTQERSGQISETATPTSGSAPTTSQPVISNVVSVATDAATSEVGGETVRLTGVTAISDVTPSQPTPPPTPVMLTPNFAAMANTGASPRPITSTPATFITTVTAASRTKTPANEPTTDTGKTINDLFKCVLCRVYFEDQAMYRSHSAHHGQTIGTCRVCNRMFRTPLLFMNHLHCSFQCRGVTPLYSPRGRGGIRGQSRAPGPQVVPPLPGSLQMNSRGSRTVNSAANISLAQAMSVGMASSTGQHRITPMAGNVRTPIAGLTSMSPRTATTGRRGRPPLNAYTSRAPSIAIVQQQQQQQRRQQQQHMQQMMPRGPSPGTPMGQPPRRRNPNTSDVIVID